MVTHAAMGRTTGHAGLARAAAAWLDWYEAMGVTDGLRGAAWTHSGADLELPLAGAAGDAGPEPTTEPPPPPAQGRPAPSTRAPAAQAGGDRVAWAREVAAACGSLAELEAALDGFEGCSLRATATRLCFADGPADARLMLIGEAPGADEDRLGKPFVGQSGQLLDRILAAAGLERRQVYITNCIYWRPPGNRAPTAAEIAVCQPFLERQIELLAPSLLLFLGGSAARVLLDLQDGVTRLRGRALSYRTAAGREVPARVTFHPAYLLRQPLQKRFVWRDMLKVAADVGALHPQP